MTLVCACACCCDGCVYAARPAGHQPPSALAVVEYRLPPSIEWGSSYIMMPG